MKAQRRSESRRSPNEVDRKALQLCRQVERLLDLALGQSADPILQSVWLAGVKAPCGVKRLLVEVFAPPGSDLGLVHQRLDASRGWLRAEIATGIQRKRTPELEFVVLPMDPGRNEGAGVA